MGPSISYASGTKSDYVLLGWLTSAFMFLFLLIFWWLFKKIRGFSPSTIAIYIISILCIPLFGFSYLKDGAILPNIALTMEEIGIGGYISNTFILLLNTIIFFRTRNENKNSGQ